MRSPRPIFVFFLITRYMKSHPKKCNEQTYFQQNLVTLCYIFFKNYKNLRGASSNIILGARIFSTVGIEVEHSVTNLVAV